MAQAPGNDDVIEDLITRAVQELEQRGDPGLQEFLTRHATQAGLVREGLERLRRLGILAPPPPAPAERTRYGEFKVLRRIGTGGMGVVYAAEQTSLQRVVALKVVRPEFLLSATARERFQREVEAIARLQHPGIVPILAVGNDDTQPWFAMEHIDGLSLEELVVAMHGKDPARADGAALRTRFGDAPGRLASGSDTFAGSYWEACVRLVLQVATTMSYVHERGIVHRDLKPSNLVVDRQGRVLVLDFGLAHVRDLHRVTRDEKPLGSPAYASPEQIRGEAVDERVDVYGLGVTLYELLTTHLPFAQESWDALQQAILAGNPRSVRAWNRAVPRDLEIVCAVAIDRDRSRRYGSMADFAADLEAVLARRAILARPLGPGLRLVRFAQRHPTWAVAASAALLVALQFPLVLWRQQANANAALADSNARLEVQRRLAVASHADALATIEQMLVQTAQNELATTPGTEDLQLSILTRADQLLERMRAQNRGDRRLDYVAAQNLQFIGSLLADRGDYANAEARYETALARLADRGEPHALHLRGSVWRLLGLCRSRRGDVPAAEAAVTRAICDLEAAIDLTPWERTLRRQYAESWSLLARIREQQGDRPARLDLLLRTQALKDRLHDEQPDDLDGALSCALGCEHLANELRRQRSEQALQFADRGIDILSRFLPQGPRDRDLRTRLGNLLETRGNIHSDAKRLDAAEDDHGRAFAVRWSLAQDFPATASHWFAVAASLNNLAIAHDVREDLAGAAQFMTESVERYRQAVRMAPRNVEYAQGLEMALANLCRAMLLVRDLDRLATTVEELAAVATRPKSLVTAAHYALRLAVRLRERDGEAAEPLVLDWRERAMTLIETAITRGFTDRAHFETGPNAHVFDDLRSWPEFVAAMARLPAKKP